MKKFLNIFNKVLDVVYPNHVKCVFCGEETSETSVYDCCKKCWHELPFIKSSCPRCGGPILEGSSGVCLDCKRNNYDFDQAKSVFIYEGKVLSAVHRYKYNACLNFSTPFAQFMAEIYASWNICPDYITAVPMFKDKEKERGYNQAKCLATELSKMFNLPYIDFCVKVTDNPSQTNFSFAERSKNVLNAYKFNREHKKLIKNKTVLLIDDVFTTGATSSEVSRVLKNAGASAVYVLTFAHTIRKNLKV